MKMLRFMFGLAVAFSLAAVHSAEAAALLAIDVDDRTAIDSSPPNTVPGFLSFTMDGTTASAASLTKSVGGYTLSLTTVNAAGEPQGAFDDRDRTTPSSEIPLAQLYDDFIFVGNTAGIGGGLDLHINSNGALQPNTQYLFSVYSFDSGSTPDPQPRTSNWLDGNNSDALVLSTAFSGGSANLPATDNQYKFTGVVTTDNSGNLLLRARNTSVNAIGNVEPGVFINGLEINVIPEPAALALTALAAAMLLRRSRA